MMPRLLFVPLVLAAGLLPLAGQEDLEQEIKQSSEEHMREELGVNDVTAPSIAQILRDLGSFKPIPMDIINANKREAAYDNRLQTGLHLGALVADGFFLTIAERPQDLQDIGRALIRQSRALGVNDRLTRRSKSLLELSDKGDWVGMREELIRTQTDVEKSMLDMKDEEIAHMVSLGGWARGFQLAAHSTVESFTPDKARILGNGEIMDYYLDRLGTLHPSLKKTATVSGMIARLRDLRAIATGAEGRVPTPEEVQSMSVLADELVAVALATEPEQPAAGGAL